MALEVATAGTGELIGLGAETIRAAKIARAMKAVTETGRVGEEAVRALEDIGVKQGFKVAGRSRVADGMNETTVNEVKNVARQGWTKQLQDNAEFARSTGRQFQLWVRGGENGTKLSGPLRAAVNAGKVVIRTF